MANHKSAKCLAKKAAAKAIVKKNTSKKTPPKTNFSREKKVAATGVVTTLDAVIKRMKPIANIQSTVSKLYVKR